MSEHLPAPPGDPRVLLEAMALAAAKIAAEQMVPRVSPRPDVIPLSREEIEALVTESIHAAFLRVHIDLDNLGSVARFTQLIAHAEQGHTTWDRVRGSVVGALSGAVVSGLIWAIGKATGWGTKG